MLVRELAPGIEERNFAKEHLTRAEIEALVDRAGGVAAVLSTRNANAKERGWTLESPPDRASFIEAASADNNLLRRPILVHEDGVVIGKDDKAYRRLLST